MRKQAIFFILVLLLCGVCSAALPPLNVNIKWCGSQDVFFWNASSADVSGYRIINNYPELDSTRSIYTTVSSATGQKTIGSFIIPAKTDNPIRIEPGLWRFRMYHNVSSSVGITQFEYHVFNRSSTGVETDLFYGQALTSDINSLTTTETLLSYARRNITTMFPGDRLVIKVNASTTSVTSRDAWMTLSGNTMASMVSIAYFVCDDDTIPYDGSGTDKASGILFGLIGGFLGGLILIKRKGGFT
jgi:hypothetical protein